MPEIKDGAELVICDSLIAGSAHKELYRFSEESYLLPDAVTGLFSRVAGVVEDMNGSPQSRLSKIHLALSWENLLMISLWRESIPSVADSFVVLSKAGIGTQELEPFKNADVADLFPWLYYAKRFDVLRKICHAAKKQTEGRIKNHSIRVDCHLVAEDAKRIVASSL
ncbi:MAG: hypothetical protein EPN22_01590 [Nitrospirae bacterium]|nr:MAG: hypothetical protein EPN22_01590 [Nitrospirota bacterium]